MVNRINNQIVKTLLVFIIIFISPLIMLTGVFNLFIGLLIASLIFVILLDYSITKLRINKTLIFCFVIYFLWLVFIFLFYGNSAKSFIRLAQFVSCFLVFLLGYSFDYSGNTKLFLYSLYVLLFAILAFWLYQHLPINNYRFIFNNANAFGTYCLYLLPIYFLFSNKTKRIGVVVLLLFFISISSSRTALLSALIFVLLAFLFSFDAFTTKRTILLFLITICLCFSIVLLYNSFEHTALFGWLNDYSIQYFHKYLNSGRNTLWPLLIDTIKKSPLWGYGLSSLPQDFVFSNLSSHNLYLQSALQSGLIGVALLINVVFQIFRRMTHYSFNIGLACTIAVLFHESFEISLTQNYLSFGLIIWLIWGIGSNPNNVSSNAMKEDVSDE